MAREQSSTERVPNNESSNDKTDTKKSSDIERLEAENRELRNRIEQLEEVVIQSEPSETEQQAVNEETEAGEDGLPNISRRGALTGLAGLGILGAGATGTAAANSLGEHWQDDIDGPGLEISVNNMGFRANVSDNSGIAIYGRSEGSDGRGLWGLNTASSGNAYGMVGRTLSSEGIGVYGWASDNGSNVNYGVRGETQSSRGIGCFGIATADSGLCYGLYGRTSSSEGIALYGNAVSETGETIGLRGRARSPNGNGVEGYNAASSGETVGVFGEVASPDGYGLYTPDDAKIEGDLVVEGTKHFVQAVDTPAGQKKVAYNAVEAGRARTEVSGTAEMADGSVEIELPEHFTMVTSEQEELSVQLTPHAKELAHPQVVECSTERLIVDDFTEPTDEYVFSYTVKGIREGFEDQPIMRDS